MYPPENSHTVNPDRGLEDQCPLKMAYVQGLCSFPRWVVPLIYQILVSTKNGLCSGSMLIYQILVSTKSGLIYQRGVPMLAWVKSVQTRASLAPSICVARAVARRSGASRPSKCMASHGRQCIYHLPIIYHIYIYIILYIQQIYIYIVTYRKPKCIYTMEQFY